MAKMSGRFKHINKGRVIEYGREVEFRIELKSGDEFNLQIPVAEIPRVVRFLEALELTAREDEGS
jgi:hypothetical protein